MMDLKWAYQNAPTAAEKSSLRCAAGMKCTLHRETVPAAFKSLAQGSLQYHHTQGVHPDYVVVLRLGQISE